MPSSQETYDVVIIGGGPAGSTAASYLSIGGLDAIVLEKEKFPRDHVGESLLPFCYHLFEEIGMLEHMKAHFVRKPGVRFVDSDGRRATSWCFDHVIHDPSHLSFQVTRSKFDQMLLENARRLGATVHEQTHVKSVDVETTEGLVEVQAQDSQGSPRTYRGRFLLDASGRNAFLATRMRWRKRFEGLDRTALWTHWDGANFIGGLQEGLSLIVYLGGDKKGWIWIFPLSTDRVTVGVVLNNEYIRQEKSKFQDANVEDWGMSLYLQELGYSSFAARVLEDAEVTQPLTVEGDYSYYVEKKYGDNFALIGDASTFIDPIFSSGIFLSMKGSKLVSEAVLRLLKNGEASGAQALASAYEDIDGAYGLVHRMIRLFYNPHAINFAEAGSAVSGEHLQHENAMATGHFLLAGDFFERHAHYTEFFDLLESPKLFKKYKESVIDREQYQASTCGADRAEVFPTLAQAGAPEE